MRDWNKLDYMLAIGGGAASLLVIFDRPPPTNAWEVAKVIVQGISLFALAVAGTSATGPGPGE